VLSNDKSELFWVFKDRSPVFKCIDVFLHVIRLAIRERINHFNNGILDINNSSDPIFILEIRNNLHYVFYLVFNINITGTHLSEMIVFNESFEEASKQIDCAFCIDAQ